jgi:hypothetical protein
LFLALLPYYDGIIRRGNVFSPHGGRCLMEQTFMLEAAAAAAAAEEEKEEVGRG